MRLHRFDRTKTKQQIADAVQSEAPSPRSKPLDVQMSCTPRIRIPSKRYFRRKALLPEGDRYRLLFGIA